MQAEKSCTNCDSQLKEEALFCNHCGQKYRIGKPTLWMILGDFFSSLFNLDSSIYRSFLALFIPGKLSNAFFEGKIKRYAPPIRVFIVSSIFLVAALSAYNNSSEEQSESDLYSYEQHRYAVVDEIEEKRLDIYNQFPDSSTFLIIDTLIHNLTNGEEYEKSLSVIQLNTEAGGFSFTSDGDKSIPSVDVFRLTEDSLFRKYEVEEFFPKLIVRQQIKNFKNGDGLGEYMISRITIQALIMMPVIALILKLLYWRRKKYFVDHFVFSLHYHSFAFLLLGILILIEHFFNVNEIMFLIVFFIILAYLFFAMKQVYKQSVGKTVLKFLLLNLTYIIVVAFFGTFSVIFSFLTF